MTGWRALGNELDRWQAAGRVATLWWRDDDAMRSTPALDRLLQLREAAGPPIAVAVVPANADASLANALAGIGAVSVLQHGYDHRNHAPRGEKKAELGPHRSPWVVSEELAEGRRRCAELFAHAMLDVLVPPWNRIDDALIPSLPKLGFTGLSCFAPRVHALPAENLVWINAHIDIVDWRGTRTFVGEVVALEAAIDHLVARRLGTVDSDEPTGLLTHHLVHDADCWRFAERFLSVTAAHPAARWLSAAEVFGVNQR